MKDEEKKKYHEQITDSWRLFYRYADLTIEGRDADRWKELLGECEALYEKYKTNFIRRINTVMVDEIERRARKEKI